MRSRFSSLFFTLLLLASPAWATEPRLKRYQELFGWSGSTGPDLTSAGDVSGTTVAFTGLVSCNTIDSDASGNFLCGVDATGGGGGNSFETISVPAGASVVADSSTDTLTLTETSFLTLTGTAATDTIDITQITTDLGTDGLIAANAVALGTDTTNAYVTDLTAGTYIDVSGGGAETASVSVTVDPTEILDVTFAAGANASQVWTWNLSGTDPTLTFGSALVTVGGALTSTGTITGQAVAVTGTAGLGYLDFLAQSSNPAAPAAGTIRLHSATTQGFTRLEQDNESATNIILGRDSVTIAKNTSGVAIATGEVLYISGSTGNVPNIAKAKANAVATLPAIFVAVDAIADNAFGQVMRQGVIANFNTNSLGVAGTPVYVNATTAGALTATRPSGTTNFVQRVGTVLVQGIGNGSLDVLIAPAVLNMETGTNAATWTATAGTFGGLVTANANLNIANGATTAGVLKLLEDTDAGSDFASFQVPALAADTVYTLPTDDGSASEVLSTDGSGVLDWVAAGAGDVTAVGDCASGACFNGTQGTTLTFNNAGGDAALIYDGSTMAFDKPLNVTTSSTNAAQNGVSITTLPSYTVNGSYLTQSLKIVIAGDTVSANNTSDQVGIRVTNQNTATAKSVRNLYGFYASMENTDTGTNTAMVGVQSDITGGPASSANTNLYGAFLNVDADTATNGSVYGLYALVDADIATNTTLYGAYLDVKGNTGANLTTNIYGLYLNESGTAAGTLNYGLFQNGTRLNQLGGTLNLGATGVSLANDLDGAITFKSLSAGSAEDLTLNLDDTANTVVASSSTGVTNLTFTSIGSTWGALVTANANITVGNGATTAGVLTLLEDTDAGSDFASFQVPALAANTVYTLPVDDGAASEVLSTDGAGVLDWVAAGAGDITDVYNCASGDCNSIVLADGDLLNMSSVSVSSATEGLILPGHATDCSSAGTAEGQVCWEADANTLYVGDGATVTRVDAGVITAGRSLTRTTNDIVADAETYTDEKCAVVETPTDADNFLVWRADLASTVTSVDCIVESATSAVITFQECDTAGDTCGTIESVTCDVDGATDNGIDGASIDATDWIRLDIGTVTGTVGHVTACMTITRDD